MGSPCHRLLPSGPFRLLLSRSRPTSPAPPPIHDNPLSSSNQFLSSSGLPFLHPSPLPPPHLPPAAAAAAACPPSCRSSCCSASCTLQSQLGVEGSRGGAAEQQRGMAGRPAACDNNAPQDSTSCHQQQQQQQQQPHGHEPHWQQAEAESRDTSANHRDASAATSPSHSPPPLIGHSLSSHNSPHSPSSRLTPSSTSPSSRLTPSSTSSHRSSSHHPTFPPDSPPFYPSQVPTSPLQKAAIAVASSLGALLNPGRADLVAASGETLDFGAFERMRGRMRADAMGRAILSDRPRISEASVGLCWALPPSTFGGAYAHFMGSRNFSPNDRPPVRFIDDAELAFVVSRARETHDFWHVLFGLPTTVTGELALKLVEFVQTGMPMCGLAAVGAPLRLSSERRQYLVQVLYPWAIRAGMNASDLMCIYYEKHLEEDLVEVRRKWGIEVAPPIPKLKSS